MTCKELQAYLTRMGEPVKQDGLLGRETLNAMQHILNDKRSGKGGSKNAN